MVREAMTKFKMGELYKVTSKDIRFSGISGPTHQHTLLRDDVFMLTGEFRKFHILLTRFGVYYVGQCWAENWFTEL